jgi:hypothetical protein
MSERNQTVILDFLFFVLNIQPEHKHLFFALFLAMYLVTVLWNLIIVLIQLDAYLHTPIHLFLSHLSLEGSIGVIPFLLIIMSYAHIVSSILMVPSSRSIQISSTCGSHLFVVLLFCGTAGTLYLCPSANNSIEKDIVIALMYTVVTPMPNAFIYSLRNRDVHGSLRRLLCKSKIPFFL